MKFIKWRKRKKISNIYVLPGDEVVLVDTRRGEGFFGSFFVKSEKELLRSEIGRPMTIDEVGIFDARVDGRDAVGGVFIDKNKKNVKRK